MSENRLKKRIAKSLLAQFATSTMQFFAYVQDVATGGLGANCNRKLDVGTEVKIKLNVPGHSTMEVVGKVAWRRDLPSISKNKFHVGVALVEPPQNYIDYVTGLIKRDYERRKSPRYSDILEIQAGDVLDLLDAAIADVSAEGLYVRTGKPLEVGAQYEMALVNKEDIPDPLYCLGEVVASFECDPDDLDHAYGAGIKIISFADNGAERFAEYLRNLDELYQFHWPENVPELKQGKMPINSGGPVEEIDIDID